MSYAADIPWLELATTKNILIAGGILLIILAGGIQLKVLGTSPTTGGNLGRLFLGIVGIALVIWGVLLPPPTVGGGETKNVAITPSPPAPGPEAAPPVPAGDSDCGLRRLSIVSPANGTAINGQQGVKIIVKVCAGSSPIFGWLFDFDPYDSSYYRTTDTPYSTPGTFTFNDQPIGDKGDKNKKYYVVLVSADEACNNVLKATEENEDGDFVYYALPKGCNVAQQAELIVTW